MALSEALSPAVQCAEDIAFLHLLHPVIASPFKNPVAVIQQKGYTLPFDKERRLASTLAFLSSTKDDPNHIPAICIAEDTRLKSLNVLLAVNKTDPEDGNQELQQAKKNFENIFQILSQVQDIGVGVQHDVFASIIAMCRDRILCRLGLIATSRNTMKQSIKTILQEAIQSLNLLRTKSPRTEVPFSRDFIQRAKEVVKKVDLWTKHQTEAELQDLVASVYYLAQTGNVQSILAAIPNTSMDPSLRKRLLNVINKVGRYSEAARFLFRIAKRFTVVREMRAVVVNLPPELFQRPAHNQYQPTLLRTLSRFRGGHGQRDLGQICSLMKMNQQDTKTQFAQRVTKTIEEAKIHAEIQLLYHYDIESSTSSTLPPRVVCSSKDACYMCNSFILMHRKMHTPRCHGKIYPGWRLPSLPACQGTEERFNILLEALIRNKLNGLLVKRKRIVYPDPNESTLLTLPHSMSTVVSVAMPVAEEEISVAPPLPVENVSPAALSENISDTAFVAALPLQPITGSYPESSLRSTSSQSTFGHYIELTRGHPVAGKAKPGALSRFYLAGRLELIVECSTANTGESDHNHDGFSYSVEWLEEDGASLQQPEVLNIIDAESLNMEVTYDIDQSFIVAGHGSAVKVRVRTEG